MIQTRNSTISQTGLRRPDKGTAEKEALTTLSCLEPGGKRSADVRAASL